MQHTIKCTGSNGVLVSAATTFFVIVAVVSGAAVVADWKSDILECLQLARTTSTSACSTPPAVR